MLETRFANLYFTVMKSFLVSGMSLLALPAVAVDAAVAGLAAIPKRPPMDSNRLGSSLTFTSHQIRLTSSYLGGDICTNSLRCCSEIKTLLTTTFNK